MVVNCKSGHSILNLICIKSSSFNLQLDKILGAQTLQSEVHGENKIHDEHLFIIIHQSKDYEVGREGESKFKMLFFFSLRIMVQTSDLRGRLNPRHFSWEWENPDGCFFDDEQGG